MLTASVLIRDAREQDVPAITEIYNASIPKQAVVLMQRILDTRVHP